MKKQCHIPTQIRKNNTTSNKKKPPRICPRCKKGFHWLNECHSKFDKDGNTLNPGAQQKTGKLIKGTSSSPTTKGAPNVMTLQAATSKSACIDIPSPYDMELIKLYNPHKIPTGNYGPIPPRTMGLILGHSSCTMRSLMVLTSVMDKDYEGEIHGMVNVMKMGNVYLQKGESFAQLLFLPYVKPMKVSDKVRQGGFGSTNLTAALSTLLKEHQKPILTLRIWEKIFTGMLDTGANISIIRAA